MLDYLKTPVIIFILFVFVVNVLFFVKNIKRMLYLVTLIISFIIPAALFVLKYLEISLPDVLNLKIEWLCAIASAVLVVLNICFLKAKTSNNEFFKAIPAALDRKILGYLDKDGKLIHFSQYFFEELDLDEKEQKKWNEHVSKIYYNSVEISYSDLLNALAENDGSESKITLALKNDDELNEEISFNFVKVNVDVNEDTIGYVLLVKNEQPKNLVDGFGYILDSVDAPYAYYNDDSRNVIFRTNKSFKNLLGVRGYNVTYSELRRLVCPEDLQVFDRASSEFAGDDTYEYRMVTSLGLNKFKETKVTRDNHVITIIQMTTDNEGKAEDKKDVFEKIDKLIAGNVPFGGMMVSLNSFVDLFNSRGPVLAKELSTRFVEYVRLEVLGKDDMICKISDIEYLLLFTDMEKFDSLVRDIQNKVSVLSRYEFNYGNEVISSTNSIGIVYKNENITNQNDFLNALDNALSLANKDGEEDGVSLYSAVKKEPTDNKLTKENYSFDKVKISLDNSFLDDDEV